MIFGRLRLTWFFVFLMLLCGNLHIRHNIAACSMFYQLYSLTWHIYNAHTRRGSGSMSLRRVIAYSGARGVWCKLMSSSVGTRNSHCSLVIELLEHWISSWQHWPSAFNTCGRISNQRQCGDAWILVTRIRSGKEVRWISIRAKCWFWKKNNNQSSIK